MQIRNRIRGVTLIELMVVVAIIAILATIAYPSYREQVRKGNRSAAQSHLMQLSLRQQQLMLDVRAYEDSLADLNIAAPEDVTRNYDLELEADNAAMPPVFTITATPKGSQAGDRCGELSINQAGAKGAAESNCW